MSRDTPTRRTVYRGRKSKRFAPPGVRVNPKEVQMALKLMGGTTAKDRGEPFNDEIPF